MVRFFADGEELRADTVVLTGENAQHAKVLRLKAGETVLVCDGRGTECLCEVTDAGEMKLNVLKRRERRCGSVCTWPFPRRTSWSM